MRKNVLGAAAMLLAAGPSMAQDLGVVSNVASGELYCGDQPLTLDAPYTCYELTVSCPETTERIVNLRVTEPPGGTAIRAAIENGRVQRH